VKRVDGAQRTGGRFPVQVTQREAGSEVGRNKWVECCGVPIATDTSDRPLTTRLGKRGGGVCTLRRPLR
jgi:hypothetical protein